METIARLLLWLLVAYAVLVLAAFLLQRRFLYFPDTTQPSAGQVTAAGLRTWPSVTGPLRGYTAAAPLPTARGTVVVFHGNAGAAWHRNYYVRALRPLGYRVILAEYPGYGGRSGAPTEEAIVADAKTTLRLAYDQYGDPIYLWGESLGSGVVAAVAADGTLPVAGLVLITPWDSLPALAQSLYPFLPMRWLLLDRYDNLHNLRAYRGPAAVAIAGADEIIPPHRAERLYSSLAEPKRLWVFEHAGHNSWPGEAGGSWWREVTEFMANAGSSSE